MLQKDSNCRARSLLPREGIEVSMVLIGRRVVAGKYGFVCIISPQIGSTPVAFAG